MDIDEDDDFYAPEDADVSPEPVQVQRPAAPTDVKPEVKQEDLEEGEEEDEEDDDDDEDDDDIVITTQRKDGSKAAAPTQARYNEIRSIPQRTGSSDVIVKQAPAKKKTAAKEAASSADLPAVATSKIDIDAKPVYDPAGKPITQVNIDEDLPDNDKPWRRPGTDISDYFNYGFDEFTWALYAAKQDGLRAEYDQDKVAQNQKKMMEDMNMMMTMGGMPGMPAMPGMPGMPGMPTPAAAAGMPGMEGIPPEMQAMMQQMMASGMDPSQMDPSAMFGATAGATGGQSNAGQAFGSQQGFGQAGYGYDQHSGGNRGNFRGKGRGRNW